MIEIYFHDDLVCDCLSKSCMSHCIFMYQYLYGPNLLGIIIICIEVGLYTTNILQYNLHYTTANILFQFAKWWKFKFKEV